jgi:molybdate transport system substrate-binding protein
MKVSALILAILLLLFVGCLNGGVTAEYKVTEFSDLFKNGTKIASCDTVHCPAGKYASMVVSSVTLNDSEAGAILKRNIVTNDPHVRAVLDKVVTREVDAGFVYLTDAFIENDTVRIIEIPREFSPLPQYSVSTIKDSQNPEEAKLFEDFLTSKEGQQILVKHGFVPAVQEPISFGRHNTSSGKTLTIYAASSLTEVFTEFTDKFKNATGVTVVIGFGSSGTLRQKIEAGAPADIYAPAALGPAEILIEQGFLDGYTVFARNHLVVVAPR